MGRRIEVELTSSREDGLWTWRAAGARQPKGELVGSLLYAGAKVGDVVKVEAEFHVDGIEVTEVFAPTRKKERTDLLELKTRPLRDDELVTTQRVRRDRDDRPRRGREGDRRDSRPRGEHGDRRDDRRRDRTPPPDQELRPKPKRLRPRRTHREALLAETPEEHRPIVEQLVRDGMPGVRAAIEKQNAEAKEQGKPEIESGPIISIAERHLPKARLAEWLDRADAAIASVGELDLRDLRSVVVAGNDVARDEQTRELVEQLRTALDERVEADHTAWLDDLESAVTNGRVVRALRLSSRPVKAGAPLPAELASTLAGQASAALAADTPQERWATVIDALAYSPVRAAVVPLGVPAEPSTELITALKRLADRVPAIASLFGIDPAEAARAARRRGARGGDGRRRGGTGDKPAPGGPRARTGDGSAPADAAAANGAVSDGAADDHAASDGPVADAPAADAPVADASAADASVADTPEADAPVAAVADTTAPPVETTEAGDAAEAVSTEAAPAEAHAEAHTDAAASSAPSTDPSSGIEADLGTPEVGEVNASAAPVEPASTDGGDLPADEPVVQAPVEVSADS